MAEPERQKNPKALSKEDKLSKIFGSGNGKIKKKIRDIERFLKKDNLPANIRVDNERTLKALKVQLINNDSSLKTKKIAKKYHMVRFFERKKALRLFKKAKKAYEETLASEDRKMIKKARTVLKHKEVELVYTVLYPKDEKYVSLYPNLEAEQELSEKAKIGLRATEEKRKQFKQHVETLIKDNKLPFSLNDIIEGKIVLYDQQKKKTEIAAPDAYVEGDNKVDNDDFFEEEL